MKIAVISDIHANLPAFKAVLQDIEKQKINQIYCTGDLVGYAPFPNEVIELVREHKIPTVMGNYDDGVGNMRLICGCDYKDEKAQALGEKSIGWSKEHTTEENKKFLRELPKEIRVNLNAKSVLMVHGSPNRLNEYIYEDVPAEYISKIFEENNIDILVCGHTHKPFYKFFGNKLLINSGSVGKPKHGSPEATYVLISFQEDQNNVDVSIRNVNYEYELTANAIERSDLPNEFADLLRVGKG